MSGTLIDVMGAPCPECHTVGGHTAWCSHVRPARSVRGTELVHSSYVAETTAEIMRLKAALDAAEAREREAYYSAAEECHRLARIFAGRQKLDAMQSALACAEAVRALAKERT